MAIIMISKQAGGSVFEGEIDVCSIDELKNRGIIVVNAIGRTIALIHSDGKFFAIDNRCPHMGYPLSKGTVKDGVLTCHWHHARFDMHSGCTFDLFADDTETFTVRASGDRVILIGGAELDSNDALQSSLDNRLVIGIDHSVDLVLAKSIIREIDARGEEYGAIRVLELASGIGASKLRGWGSGLTILTCMSNTLPYLDGEWKARALFKGVKHVAADAFQQAVRPVFEPLSSVSEGDGFSFVTLSGWFRTFVEQREEDACQRALLTVIRDFSREEIAEMLFAASTDHVFLEGGHVYDFLGKAFELLKTTGWHHAPDILPSLVKQLCNARRHEEDGSWRHPVDLIELIRAHESKIPELLKPGRALNPSSEEITKLAWTIISGEPQTVLDALDTVISDGWPVHDVALSLTLSAAFRIALFHRQNEFGDWITVLHTLSYCNAVMNSSCIVASPEPVVKGIYHGAMKVFLDRFLNIPPADVGTAGRSHGQVGEFLSMLEHSMNSRDGDSVVHLIDDCVGSGATNSAIVSSLARCVLREDAEFHTYQMLEATSNILKNEKITADAQRLMLIAAARYIGAHSPTDRADQQVFDIALRLERGQSLHV